MFNIQDFIFKGKAVEQKIIDSLNGAIAGTQAEDKRGIDFKIEFNFDVKSAKKIRRSDPNVSYDLTWLEYRNIYGMPGSLLKETIDYFVFERESTWEIRSRKSTLEFFKSSCILDSKCKDIMILSSEPVKLYTPYQRKDRQDIIMLVEFSNPLWGSAEMIIPKSTC